MDAPAPEFCAEAELGYARAQTRFDAETALRFDRLYRVAHLPLVNPRHPLVIAEDGPYRMGVHARVYSLVIPLPDQALRRSANFLALEREIRSASFAAKISWDIVEQRRDKLHATICGSLSVDNPPVIGDAQIAALAAISPFEVEIRGLFSGEINLGRLYLKAYPQKRATRNVFQDIQAALGRKLTDLYPVGLYNFTEELTVPETTALADIIRRWRDVPLLRFKLDRLWLLGSSDDLVLESAIARTIKLGESDSI